MKKNNLQKNLENLNKKSSLGKITFRKLTSKKSELKKVILSNNEFFGKSSPKILKKKKIAYEK